MLSKNPGNWQILLLVLLCFFGFRANAQTGAIGLSLTHTTADSLAQIAREDTSYAVRRLFFATRRRARTYTILSGLSLSYGVIRGSLEYFRQPGLTEAKVGSSIFIAGSAAFLVRNIILLRRYRPSREKKLLTELEAGKPLPYTIRHQLKPSYFDTGMSNR